MSEDDQRQPRSDKRRNGIIGAGLCGAQSSLSIYVEENTETVCHKSEQKGAIMVDETLFSNSFEIGE